LSFYCSVTEIIWTLEELNHWVSIVNQPVGQITSCINQYYDPAITILEKNKAESPKGAFGYSSAAAEK
jgi:hypothetical protein